METEYCERNVTHFIEKFVQYFEIEVKNSNIKLGKFYVLRKCI